MAKKQPEPQDSTPTENDQAINDMPPGEASLLYPEIKKINEILSSHEISGGKIRIEGKRPTDTKYAYIVTVPIEQFDIDWVKNTYGGGDYICKTFRSNGQMYKPFDFSIDSRIKGSIDGQPAVTPPPVNNMAQMAQVLTAMRGGEESNQALMVKMMEQSDTKQSQMMTLLMTMMMESNKTMVATLSAALQAVGGKSSNGDMIMPVMLEMIRNRDKTDLGSMISVIKELKGMTDGNGAIPEKEDMLDKVMKYAGPVVTSLLTRVPMQLPRQPSAHVEVQPVDPASNIKVLPTNPIMTEVKAYADMLISSARRDADVEPIAHLIISQLDDQRLDDLLNMLDKPDWIEVLAKDDQRIKDYPMWFGKLRDSVINLTTEPESAESNPESMGKDYEGTSDKPGDVIE